VTEFLDDLEADFLAIYRIKDPWSIPARRFFSLARRTVYYQGSVQGRLMVEEQEQEQDPIKYKGNGQLDTMRHNAAAAKMAGKGLKDGDQVQVVPLSVFMNMAGVEGEYTQVKAG
jgi:hypothetical protein